MAAESDAGADVVAAMQALARRITPTGGTPESDFELLVGAFESQSQTLDHLRALAVLAEPNDTKLMSAFGRVASFASRVRDAGISHVLEVIFERSHARIDLTDDLHAFVRSIVAGFGGRITFGNLNYDTLLLSALLATCQDELTDLGDPQNKVSVRTSPSTTREVPGLRTTANFLASRRVRLLHLHGSLTYWKDADGTFAKLDTVFLRANRLWAKVRKDSTSFRPVVILANQQDKTGLVGEYPFALAYNAFASSLDRTNHWLIVGYSFRDECVNDMLRREFTGRAIKPTVLVATYGNDPKRTLVEESLGWDAASGDSSTWLTIMRGGAHSLAGSRPWRSFAPNATQVT